MRLTVTRSHLNHASWPPMGGIRYPACILCRGMDRIVRKCCDVFIPFHSSKIMTADKCNGTCERTFFIGILGL